MESRATILVIDDEAQIRRLLAITLEASGYRVTHAATGEEGIAHAAMDHPEVAILDLGLPDMDGLAVLKRIREWSTIPVVILSVRNAEQDIIACLNAGADDYLVKPFRTGELVARVKAALRHRQALPTESAAVMGPLTIDFSARVVKKNGVAVKLTGTEYSLLSLFVRNAGKVLTHRYILEQIWGPTFAEETQYSRVYVGQLRKKLEDDPANPRLLLTESGIGYRLAADE